MAAYYYKIAVGHIEAGRRSHDLYNPFPEEANRRLASVLAEIHLPSRHCPGTTCEPKAWPRKRSWLREIQ
jgi:UDP-N-acetylglucosamine 2-epimerase